MQVQIEFLGLSRLVSGQKEVSFEIAPDTTFRDIVGILASAEVAPRWSATSFGPTAGPFKNPTFLT